MGKIELFKGALSGTVTSFSQFFSGFHFTIEVNEEIEGLPKEFLISFIDFVRSGYSSNYRITFLRKGDMVSIGGTVIQKFVGKEQLEQVFMKANYVYNTTLKHGVGLKIRRKKVFERSSCEGIPVNAFMKIKAFVLRADRYLQKQGGYVFDRSPIQTPTVKIYPAFMNHLSLSVQQQCV